MIGAMTRKTEKISTMTGIQIGTLYGLAISGFFHRRVMRAHMAMP